MINLNDSKTHELLKLVSLIKELNTKGHNVATSGNYSLKFQDQNNEAYISESGIDKSQFCINNLFEININSFNATKEDCKSKKPSDETPLHMMIYSVIKFGCVLHSHFLESLIFAKLHYNQKIIEISGLEMIKAFKGLKSHEDTIRVLMVENSQDIYALASKMKSHLEEIKNCYALLLKGHGIYVWGENVDSAKRHLEAYQYIFQYLIREREIL